MLDARLSSRPEARTPTIEQLLSWVRAGRVRLPRFQRTLRWRSKHVTALFDSIYRGFPISDLLLSQQPAAAATLAFGPVRISAAARDSAYLVIDGQQRITALVGALLHPEQSPRGDIYATWFDLEARTFHRLPGGPAKEGWIPLNVVVDSAQLLRWLRQWPLSEERPELVDAAIELGKAIREYQVSVYIVEGASEPVLRLIFKRKNTGGVSMRETEVFDALHGAADSAPLRDACLRISELGLGDIEQDVFLRCVQAVAGLNPRSRLAEREQPVGADTLQAAERALGKVLRFLAAEAGIPHLDLLPYQLPLQILSCFFHRHGHPSARSRLLLSRWLWRGALSRIHADNGNVAVAELLALIGADEPRSVQGLLQTVPRDVAWSGDLRAPWNVRGAMTHVVALALLHLRPRDPRTGEPIDITELGAAPLQCFRPLGGEGGASPSALRFVLPGEGKRGLRLSSAALMHGDLRGDLINRIDPGPRAEILASHALNLAAVAALRRGDGAAFLQERLALLTPWLQRFCRERAGAGENDRPAIAEILQAAHEGTVGG